MYEIIIKKTEIVKQKAGKDWKQTGERPVTKEEVEKSFGSHEDYKGKMSSVYGYTPEIEKEVEVDREILKQTIEELDLAAVIKAINKL